MSRQATTKTNRFIKLIDLLKIFQQQKQQKETSDLQIFR